MKRYDLIIAGAGPGGATAALSLAEAGLKVALLDKARFPRDKICGDALSGKVLYQLHRLHPSFAQHLRSFPPTLEAWGIRFVAPNRQHLDIPFKADPDPLKEQAPGFTCTRWDFDDFLIKQVRNQPGIDLYENTPVKRVVPQGSEVLVETADTPFRAPLVMGADGAHSVVRKVINDRPYPRDTYSAGVRAYFTGVGAFHPLYFIELHYLRELLPGYFWIFPLPNGACNVGLGMLSKDVQAQRANLKQRLHEIVQDHPDIAPRFARARQVGKTLGFGLPLGGPQRQLSGHRCMLVGDAAALIDPFTGEGIGNAMISGHLAAQQALACHEAQRFDDDFLQAYDKAVYQHLGSELRLSKSLQKLVRYPGLFNFVVRKANNNPSLQQLMTMMFENIDIRQTLRKPGFYFKLLMR